MTVAVSNAGKRVWRKIVVALIAGVAAIGLLAFLSRFEIAILFMEGNKSAQEIAILLMLKNAKPIIERDLKMTIPETILSAIFGNRNEGERQTDALKDVREFAEVNFKNHRLRFRDVHALKSVNGFDLHGFDFVLGWNRGNADEVLAVFNVNYFKREISEMRINQSCSFFTDLKLYVETKAKEN
jgi:hypothetical protein